MPQISVIIPVYNAEKYLQRCVESLITQTYKDFELILINDGSKDNSLSICNELKAKYDFIQVIDKPNGGASSARNAGLDVAKGKYVCFVDSDDWCEPEYLQTLYNLITKNDYDLSMIGINYIQNNVSSKLNIYSDTKIITDKEKLNLLQAGCFCNRLTDFGTDTIGMGTPWDKLYKLEIINSNKLRFNTNIKVGEDKYFIWNYFKYIDTFIYSPENLYNYVFYTDSLSRGFMSCSDFEVIKDILSSEISSQLPEITFDSLLYAIYRQFGSLIKRGFANPQNKLSIRETRKSLIQIINEDDFKFVLKNLNPKILDFKEKVIKVFIKFPLLFSILLVILRKR